MDNVFTISEQTIKLLAIYRDCNRVANTLYRYFQDGAPEGKEDDTAERLFKPFDKSVRDINEKLLEQIGTKIEWALGSGDETETQI